MKNLPVTNYTLLLQVLVIWWNLKQGDEQEYF